MKNLKFFLCAVVSIPLVSLRTSGVSEEAGRRRLRRKNLTHINSNLPRKYTLITARPSPGAIIIHITNFVCFKIRNFAIMCHFGWINLMMMSPRMLWCVCVGEISEKVRFRGGSSGKMWNYRRKNRRIQRGILRNYWNVLRKLKFPWKILEFQLCLYELFEFPCFFSQ